LCPLQQFLNLTAGNLVTDIEAACNVGMSTTAWPQPRSTTTTTTMPGPSTNIFAQVIAFLLNFFAAIFQMA
jgi:hypothetical protein